MNLGVVFNCKENSPELVLIHDYLNSNIGYATYNSEISKVIDELLKNKIYSEIVIDNSIKYSLCEQSNPYYLNVLNNYLPLPYKILWIKEVHGDINDILEESYEILNNLEE